MNAQLAPVVELERHREQSGYDPASIWEAAKRHFLRYAKSRRHQISRQARLYFAGGSLMPPIN
jgi:hypothetical protein